MTEKNRQISLKWVQSFIYSKGFIEPQKEWLDKNLTEQERLVTSVELLTDPDSLPILMDAYRKVKKVHNFTNETDEVVINEIRIQINLARSLLIYHSLGNIDD